MRGSPWSREEVEATVSDYFQMLMLELAGQSYSKTKHRNELLKKLAGRTPSAVELKHQNISAILCELGWHFIPGYKPASNYQRLLFEIVAERIRRDDRLDSASMAAADLPAVPPLLEDFANIEVAPPLRKHVGREASPPQVWASDFTGVMRDYAAREARNRSLGRAGEEFVLNFERWRLIQSRREDLASRVEHVSATQGDGLGFDVLSFDSRGNQKHIEVKTTAFGKETPFFVTSTEIARSKVDADQYHLCRLFEFRKSPRLFQMRGAISQNCQLDPVTFRATF